MRVRKSQASALPRTKCHQHVFGCNLLLPSSHHNWHMGPPAGLKHPVHLPPPQGNEKYHHSLITMKATLEDKLKKDSWSMLLEPPPSTTNYLSMPTFVTSLKLGTKKPRVWVSGLLSHMPRTPRHTF